MHLATLIFLLTYILISLGENSPRKLDRPTAALLGAVLMVMCGVLTREQAFAAVDYSTLSLLFGMMVLLAVLMQSGLPARMAFNTLKHCNSPKKLLAIIIFSSGIASALMLNDTVCLLGTPIVLQVTTQAELPAVPFLIALATSSNIGSVMTLTGNPQNMIIGHASGWSWAGFAARMVPIGLICLLINWIMLCVIYKKDLATSMAKHREPEAGEKKVNKKLATRSLIVFCGFTLALLLGAPMDFAAVASATVLLVWANRPPRWALKSVDWSLLIFFTGLFVVVEGIVRADRKLLESAIGALGTNVGLATTIKMSIVHVLGSNIFSNVPYVLIVGRWIRQMSNPMFMWLILALTSTFAGNLTLFGSVANVIVAQRSQNKAPLKFSDFLRAGIPVTVVSTAVGVGMLWVFLKLGLC